MEKSHSFLRFMTESTNGYAQGAFKESPSIGVGAQHLDHVDAIETSCIYPSMTLVTVEVYRLRNGCLRVTDAGAGMCEINAFAAKTKRPGTYLAHYARAYGAEYRDGKVFIDLVDPSRVPEAVIRVANASKDGAARTIEEHVSVFKMNFRSVFDSFVRDRFGDKFKKRLARGSSGHVYTLDFVHQDNDEPEISYDTFFALADPIFPDRSLIASKLLLHRDLLQMSKGTNPWHYIVYDDENDPWDNENLAYLHQGGVPYMAFSKAEHELQMAVTPLIREHSTSH